METTDKNREEMRDRVEPSNRIRVESPSLDLARYRGIADDVDIPEQDFDEFLRTLWDIMYGFVQNAWDVKTIPAFLPEIFDDPSSSDGDAVDSGDTEDANDEA